MKRCLVLVPWIGVGPPHCTGRIHMPGRSHQEVEAATKIEQVKDNLYIITGSGVAEHQKFQRGQHGPCSSPMPAWL